MLFPGFVGCACEMLGIVLKNMNHEEEAEFSVLVFLFLRWISAL